MPSTYRLQFDLLVALVGVIALGWLAYQLRRSRFDRGLWLVTGCIAAAEVEYVLALPAAGAAVNSAFGAGMAKLTQNLALFLFNLLLVCFFLYSAGKPHRIRREVGIFLVASGALIAVAFSIPTPLRGTRYSHTLDSDPVRLFYLVSSLYIGYTLIVGLRAAWHYARLSRPPLSLGLRIIAVAMAGKLVGGPVLRIFSNLANWTGHPIPAPLAAAAYNVLMVSIVTFLIGVVYPGIAGRVLAMGRWWNHRQAYRGLEPLWTAMNQAFPQDALHRVPPSKMAHLLTWHSMHRRYYRRAIECRDGLVQISPYLPRPAADDNQGSVSARPHAADLRTALRARADHYPPAGTVMLVAPPAHPDIDADVAELLALSRALAQLDDRPSE